MIPWRHVFWRLMQGKMRLRPWEIRQMTLPEILLALDDDTSKNHSREAASGTVFKRPAETQAYAKWYRSLTLADRIKMARER